MSETTERGVTERRFDLKVGTEAVPGIMWLPETGAPKATVCIGHGGTQHKRTDNVLALARRLVRHLGVAAVALDAPEHGDRISDPEAAKAARKALEERIAAGGDGEPLPAERMRAMQSRVGQHVGEWKALLDQLQADGHGPFGWWGVSMGTMHGLPLVSSEPRIAAAVLGLFGLRDGADEQRAQAQAINVPVLFVYQWDDELMTRESGLALWDAIGTRDKTMHVNPGGHVQVPQFEYPSFEAFYARHLLPA